MKVLILRSNPIAPDPRVEKIARGLVGQGWRVELLGWDRTGEMPVAEHTAMGVIHRLPIRAPFGSGLGNLPQLVRWQIGLMSWLLRHRQDFDAIHACDFDTVLPALILHWFFKKKLIYDIFDFYADHLRRTPGLIKKLIRKVDLWVIGKADAVILVDESRYEQIRGSKPRRLTVIYNSPEDWIPPDFPKKDESISIIRLRLAYVGLLQRERGIFELLEVLSRHPDWVLELAGFGGDQDEILEKVKGMHNVRWHGRVSYETALRLSAAADVLIATYDPAIANHRYSSPNKIFEAMMLGRPIIVAENTNIDRIVQRYNNGIVVPYGECLALEQALTRLSMDYQMREQMGRNGRLAYEKEYGWHIMRDRLIQLYQQVMFERQP